MRSSRRSKACRCRADPPTLAFDARHRATRTKSRYITVLPTNEVDVAKIFRASSVVVIAGFLLLPLSSCNDSGNSAPAADTPKLTDISGFGKYMKAGSNTTQSWPDTFRFSVRPGEYCGPPTQCDYKFPDTAFVDFTIPARTTFEVKSGNETLTEVGEAAPLGDYQYRRAALDDGSGPNPAWRIAVSVPKQLRNPQRDRTWCDPTTFDFEIVDVSQHQTSGRSAPLPVRFVWGRCQSTASPGVWYAMGSQGTPKQQNPPTPQGDCPGGAFAKSFDVCERCGGTSSLPTEKTIWGCTLAEAQANMGLPGCLYQLRSGLSCP